MANVTMEGWRFGFLRDALDAMAVSRSSRSVAFSRALDRDGYSFPSGFDMRKGAQTVLHGSAATALVRSAVAESAGDGWYRLTRAGNVEAADELAAWALGWTDGAPAKTRAEYDRDFSSGFATHLADPTSKLAQRLAGER